MSHLLEVAHLKTWFGKAEQAYRVVDGVDFYIDRGETFALLGESGCGKSMTALSLLQLNPQPASQIVSGQIRLNDRDLLRCSEADMERVRGRKIAMIFQDPQSALNPVLTIGQQLLEVLRWHFDLSAAQLKARCIELFVQVGIPDPEKRFFAYPHQLSGGMKQRVMIAMALAGKPDLLIADEPTTALDVTIQAQILGLLKKLQQETGMAILLISHDLGVVAQMADRIAVMYAGQIVETADRRTFFKQPRHPYSERLFAAMPSTQQRDAPLAVIPGTVPPLNQVFTGCRFTARCQQRQPVCEEQLPNWFGERHDGVRCHQFDPDRTWPMAVSSQPQSSGVPDETEPATRVMLRLDQVQVHFPIRKGILQRTKGWVKAVDGVSLRLNERETLAIVGESGCGKSTLAKAVQQLQLIIGGEIQFAAKSGNKALVKAAQGDRLPMQIIFQDPFASMNPRMTVQQILLEGLQARQDKLSSVAQQTVIEDLLRKVGLNTDILHRYPHAFSGGQRQRLCIARALAAEPALLICDEPTSALDVSVQAQILNLLRDLQNEEGLSYLFITHDIGVVDYLAHRIAVMYLGRVVETGSRQQVLKHPKHPYTRALLAAVPDMQSVSPTVTLTGELPSPANPPSGCHFHSRCPDVMPVCKLHYPSETEPETGQVVRCFLYQSQDYHG
ncbi:Oligopeptide/dipeptide ABC transporter, ATP-binding protein [Methylophaga frappieri]|uniref:ABC-type dipeptide transporter n=1 Tax=Methylophaga frappieri (strain ATCC BAA-2434 / DSM 25690 / JAM7) TaxID=754477 RepID=I1YEG5_METFJ|nr:ABC transporter ATP-binding protein [Methylophaga frappieri]AFJ01308.1 Oligopeptide/dipeptide ABC transporter, ATP-binding protein [Methylophaga frappieri]